MLQREGTFKVYPISWTLEEYDSKAACIAYKCGVAQQWNPDESPAGGSWSAPWAEGYDVFYRAFVIKKGGEALNDKSVKALSDAGIWDGDFDSIKGPPPRVYFIVDVAVDDYEGKITYKADWPQVNADVPKTGGGGFTPADPALLQKMRARFGTGTKAIIGGTPAVGSAPPPPPPPLQPAIGGAPLQQPAAAPAPQQPAAQAAPAVAPAATPPPAPAAAPAAAPPAVPVIEQGPAAAQPPPAAGAPPPLPPQPPPPPLSTAPTEPFGDPLPGDLDDTPF